MRIDLHCHTKKVKTGDAYTRNVTKDKFFQKVIEAEVKIIAITNHNQFDYMQYKEFKDVTEGYCDIWPGVELDIIGKADQKGNCKRGHLIVIANPKNVELFNTQVQELVNDGDVNTFQIGVKKVYETLGKCDCIYIPHFHKEPKLSDEDIQELGELLPDSSVDQHIIIWHFRRIKLCRNNAGIFHPRTPGILVITVIEKIITVITRLKMGYFNFPDSANYGIK